MFIQSQTADQPLPWELKAEIVPNDGPDFTPVLTPDEKFGHSIAVSGDTLLAGSGSSGSVRVFVRANPTSNLDWVQQGEPLIMDDGAGRSPTILDVDIDQDTALISARFYGGYPKAFIYERDNGAWQQRKMLNIPNNWYDVYSFYRVALEGNTGELSHSYTSNLFVDRR